MNNTAIIKVLHKHTSKCLQVIDLVLLKRSLVNWFKKNNIIAAGATMHPPTQTDGETMILPCRVR